MERIATFLMFEGRAREALEFYVATIPDTRIVSAETFDEQGPGPNGSIKSALFEIAGQRFMAFDSPAPHAFTFTPAISLFVTCSSADEVDQLFEALAAGGKVLMPAGAYPFSQRFAWVEDRFGVSWQLAL